nr:hypothetical protein [uncultured Dysosmobacter sp.]
MSLDGLTWEEIARVIELQLDDGARIHEFIDDTGLGDNTLHLYRYLDSAQGLLQGLKNIAEEEYQKVKEKEEAKNATAQNK